MSKRLFIAINIDPDAKLWISRLINQLPSHPNIRRTPTDNVHLTLAFLGDTDDSDIARVESAVASAATKHSPPNIRLTDIDGFPNLKHPRIIWLGMESAGITEIQRGIVEKLSESGIKLDNKSFRPHLTLARVKGNLPEEISEQLKKIEASNLAPTCIPPSVEVMESLLSPGGARYKVVSSHQFGR